MSEIKLLFKQSSHYFTGKALVMFAGFVSFPILTRVLSVDDYGIMGLVTTTIFIIIAITKMGIPESIVRFYIEFKLNNKLGNFYSTIFFSSIMVAALVAVSFALVMVLIGGICFDTDIWILFSISSLLVFTGCVNSTVISILRAEQRTKLYNFIEVINRYGSLVLSIFLIFYFIKGLYGFFIGQMIAGSILACSLAYLLWKENKIFIKNYSIDIFREVIKFGFPLIWSELGYLSLNYADRYFIQFYLGPLALGLYTAGYNLATYVTELLMYPVNYALTPIYMKLLKDKGEEETKMFFSKTFRYFVLIIVLITFGFMGTAEDLLTILASKKYLQANAILPYIIIGQCIHSLGNILNSGLFIKKKTHIVTIIVLGSCLFNMILNFLLIPYFGIVGSAIATLISYTFYSAVISYYSFKEFSFPIDYKHIFLYLAIAIGMYLFISRINASSSLYNFIIKVPAGALFYFTFILIFDLDVRRATLSLINKLREKKP